MSWSDEEESSEKKQASNYYVFDFDNLPDYEPLEVTLQMLRASPMSIEALEKMIAMDIDELIGHFQWQELMELLNPSLMSLNPSFCLHSVYVHVRLLTLPGFQRLDSIKSLLRCFQLNWAQRHHQCQGSMLIEAVVSEVDRELLGALVFLVEQWPQSLMDCRAEDIDSLLGTMLTIVSTAVIPLNSTKSCGCCLLALLLSAGVLTPLIQKVFRYRSPFAVLISAVNSGFMSSLLEIAMLRGDESSERLALLSIEVIIALFQPFEDVRHHGLLSAAVSRARDWPDLKTARTLEGSIDVFQTFPGAWSNGRDFHLGPSFATHQVSTATIVGLSEILLKTCQSIADSCNYDAKTRRLGLKSVVALLPWVALRPVLARSTIQSCVTDLKDCEALLAIPSRTPFEVADLDWLISILSLLCDQFFAVSSEALCLGIAAVSKLLSFCSMDDIPAQDSSRLVLKILDHTRRRRDSCGEKESFAGKRTVELCTNILKVLLTNGKVLEHLLANHDDAMQELFSFVPETSLLWRVLLFHTSKNVGFVASSWRQRILSVEEDMPSPRNKCFGLFVFLCGGKDALNALVGGENSNPLDRRLISRIQSMEFFTASDCMWSIAAFLHFLSLDHCLEFASAVERARCNEDLASIEVVQDTLNEYVDEMKFDELDEHESSCAIRLEMLVDDCTGIGMPQLLQQAICARTRGIGSSSELHCTPYVTPSNEFELDICLSYHAGVVPRPSIIDSYERLHEFELQSIILDIRDNTMPSALRAFREGGRVVEAVTVELHPVEVVRSKRRRCNDIVGLAGSWFSEYCERCFPGVNFEMSEVCLEYVRSHGMLNNSLGPWEWLVLSSQAISQAFNLPWEVFLPKLSEYRQSLDRETLADAVAELMVRRFPVARNFLVANGCPIGLVADMVLRQLFLSYLCCKDVLAVSIAILINGPEVAVRTVAWMLSSVASRLQQKMLNGRLDYLGIEQIVGELLQLDSLGYA